MAVSHLSAQKNSPNWSAGVSSHLHAAQFVCYSWRVADQMLFLGILFIRTHMVSLCRFMGFYLYALIRSAHSSLL